MEIKMTYVIDRIENNIAVLENINTREIINIDINLLPKNIKEGNIIKYKNNKYKIDKKEERKRRQSILEKFNKLKNK